MAELGTWAAIATILAAAIAAVTLAGAFLFRAGRLWERVRRLVDVHQQDIADQKTMMSADPGPRSRGEPEDQLPPEERMNALIDRFQGGELTPSEADELLGYIERAVRHAQASDRTGVVKKLRILEKGVESARDLGRRGLYA